MDLNHRPRHYECPALTTELQARKSHSALCKQSLGGRIRTLTRAPQTPYATVTSLPGYALVTMKVGLLALVLPPSRLQCAGRRRQGHKCRLSQTQSDSLSFSSSFTNRRQFPPFWPFCCAAAILASERLSPPRRPAQRALMVFRRGFFFAILVL